jgi:hypothetical protein
MSYYLNAEKITLKDVQKRIAATDLVTSRSLLAEGIEDIFAALEKKGLHTLAALRGKLKNAKDIPSLSSDTGIDRSYLILLRREVESWLPKPFPLADFDWLPQKELVRLSGYGLKNSSQVFEALDSPEKRRGIAKKLSLDIQFTDDVYTAVSLTRIQWVSPTAARMLIAAGCDSVKKVAGADAGKLCEDLDRVNRENGFFKGKIGLRDVRRLVMAAGYV